jgi:hypothetical protein
VQVAAVDSVGNLSVPATLALQVQDNITPGVFPCFRSGFEQCSV